MTDEIMKDAELDKVVGGSGMECIGFLTRLKAEGIYNPKTSLTPGNEVAAAAELKDFLLSIRDRNGISPFGRCQIYSDDRPNDYGIHSTVSWGSAPLTDAEDAFNIVKQTLGK